MVTGILTIVGIIISLIVGAMIKSLIGNLIFYGCIALVIFFGVKQIDKLKQPVIDLLIVIVGGFAFANMTAMRQPPAKPALGHRVFRESIEAFVESGGISPAGREVVCDLPEPLRLHNTGGMGPRGPGSGSGLCVFTSINHAANYQNEALLFNLQKLMMNEPGGGYPEKVDAELKKFAPGVEYLQYQGADPTFLEEVLKTGRMPCVTYCGRDPRYGKTIAHMVNLVYLDDKEACILDNNFEKKYLWMTRQEFLTRWTGNGGSGWVVALLAPPPPGPPRNRTIVTEDDLLAEDLANLRKLVPFD